MKDVWHAITNWIDHNRYLALCLALLLIVCAGFAGCQATTASLVDPERSVTRAEFEREVKITAAAFEEQKAVLDAQVTTYNAKLKAHNELVEAGAADLQAKEEARAEVLALLGNALVEAAQGTLSPTAYILPVIGLLGIFLGIGSSVDNLRKNRVIAEVQAERDRLAAAATPTTTEPSTV